MHEHTRYRTTWRWNPRHWVWGSYTSPSGKYGVKWRGPRIRRLFTYWEQDHPEHYEDDGCGVSFIVGGIR